MRENASHQRQGSRDGKGSSSSSSASSSSSSSSSLTKTRTESGGGEEDWTDDEQRSLEAAMQRYPASSGMGKKERWKAIAGEVKGRSFKEVIARVKFLKSQAMKHRN